MLVLGEACGNHGLTVIETSREDAAEVVRRLIDGLGPNFPVVLADAGIKRAFGPANSLPSPKLN